MTKIYIDTTSNKKIIVSLHSDNIEEKIEQELTSYKSQVVLPIIVQLLTKHSLSFQDLTAIEVNPGPGSFTGVRVGVSVANALSYTLGIPVNGKVFEKDQGLVEPVYA